MKLSTTFFLLTTVSGLFSGCASTGTKSDDPRGQYDVFLDGANGETLHTAVADKKAAVSATDAHQKAQNAMTSGDMDTALFYFVKAAEADTKDEKALLGIAAVHSQRGNYDLVTLAYRITVGLNPENVTATEGLGLELLRKGDRAEAKTWLLRAISLDPARSRALSGLGIASDLDRDFATSSAYYEFALELDPDSPKILTNYGYSRYLSGDLPAAEHLYQRALEKDADFAPARLNLGLLYTRKGDISGAQAEFERVLSKSQTYNELGFILMTEKNYEQAEQLFQKAISSSPTFFPQANENLERVRALRASKEKATPPAERTPTATSPKETKAPDSK